MANFVKINKSNVILQLKHNNRTLNEETTTINYELSKNNTYYNFGYSASSEERYNDIISTSKVLNRKDVNTMIECVVTMPKDVKAEDKEKFWNATIDFFRSRYGKDSLVGAAIHRDEPGAREHIHIDFVPLVKNLVKDEKELDTIKNRREEELKQLNDDAIKMNMTVSELEKAKCEIKKKYKTLMKTVKKVECGYKVSAKDILTKEELKLFHPSLNEHIKKVLGYEVSIINGRTKTNEERKTRNQYQLEKERRYSENEKTVLLYYASAFVQMIDEEAVSKGIEDNIERKKYIASRAKSYAFKYKSRDYVPLDILKSAKNFANVKEKKYLEKQNKNTTNKHINNAIMHIDSKKGKGMSR